MRVALGGQLDVHALIVDRERRRLVIHLGAGRLLEFRNVIGEEFRIGRAPAAHVQRHAGQPLRPALRRRLAGQRQQPAPPAADASTLPAPRCAAWTSAMAFSQIECCAQHCGTATTLGKLPADRMGVHRHDAARGTRSASATRTWRSRHGADARRDLAGGNACPGAPPVIAPDRITTVFAFTFGNRMLPNGNREPGPVNARARGRRGHAAPAHRRARLRAVGGRSGAGRIACRDALVTAINPARDARGEPVYLSTIRRAGGNRAPGRTAIARLRRCGGVCRPPLSLRRDRPPPRVRCPCTGGVGDARPPTIRSQARRGAATASPTCCTTS